MLIRDPETGRVVRKARAGEILSHLNDDYVTTFVPPHIQKLLDKGAELGWQGPKASDVAWRDVLTAKGQIARPGAQVLNTVTETIMVPDYTFAADSLEAGDLYKYTVFFDWSSVITTPGTFTLRARWGGAAGTILAASGAYAPDPTAAGTTVTGWVEYYIAVRAISTTAGGTQGSLMTIGRMNLQDVDDATVASIIANLNMTNIPVSAPAAVAVDTTVSKALSLTFQSSVATATTQCTSHIAVLESLN